MIVAQRISSSAPTNNDSTTYMLGTTNCAWEQDKLYLCFHAIFWEPQEIRYPCKMTPECVWIWIFYPAADHVQSLNIELIDIDKHQESVHKDMIIEDKQRWQ